MGVVGDGGGSTPDSSFLPRLTLLRRLVEMVISYEN